MSRAVVRPLFAVAVLLSCHLGFASAQSPFVDSRPVASVRGLPFSGVATQQTIRRMADGNSFVHTTTIRYFRDGQGRLRTEREVEATGADRTSAGEATQIQIEDPVSGRLYLLNTRSKSVVAVRWGASVSQTPSAEGPPLFLRFAGRFFGPNAAAWSPLQSLGARPIEGLNALGVRRDYTFAAGEVGNQRPITAVVEQWYSPDLGIVLLRSSHATTGGEATYRLEHVVQGEPDPALFTIPAGYTLRKTGPTPDADASASDGTSSDASTP
jgi:hypothetical protein